MTAASGQKPRRPCGEASIAPPVPKTRARAEGKGKRGRFYRPLEVNLRRGGFDYHQIARRGDIAIYEQRWSGSENVAFEVVRIRWREASEIEGRFIESAEVYPSSEQWGDYGWTVTTLDAAYEKLSVQRSGQ
jgi:hypothetical protein